MRISTVADPRALVHTRAPDRDFISVTRAIRPESVIAVKPRFNCKQRTAKLKQRFTGLSKHRLIVFLIITDCHGC